MKTPSKKPPGRDWPFAIFLMVLLVATLVLALLDRSCQPQDEPGARSLNVH